MNNIWNSIKLDYFILKSSDFRRIAIIVVFALLAGVMSKDSSLIMGIITMMSGFLMSAIFAVVEKNNLNNLYGILPVEKRETVIGRYLFTIIAGIVIVALASVLSLVVSFIFKDVFNASVFVYWLCGSFLLYCILISMQFPLYFKYDFSKMAAFANMPYIIMIIVVVFLIKKHPELFNQTIKFFIQNPYMIWAVGLIGSIVLLGISMFISISLYKNREL